MFALSLLLLALGAQPPGEPAAVVLPMHATGLSSNESMGLSLQIHQILGASGIALATDPASALAKLGVQATAADGCKAEPDCAAALGRRLGVATVIAVDATAGRKSCALHVEAVSVVDGAKLGAMDLTSPRDSLSAEGKAALQAFAVQLAPKLAALAPKKVPEPVAVKPPPATDLPRQAELKTEPPPPRQTEPQIEVARPTPIPESTGTRGSVIGLGVGAGIAAAAAIALGVVGYTDEAAIQAKDGVVQMSIGKAQERADRANALYGSAGAAAGVAAVLATVAIVLQLSD